MLNSIGSAKALRRLHKDPAKQPGWRCAVTTSWSVREASWSLCGCEDGFMKPSWSLRGSSRRHHCHFAELWRHLGAIGNSSNNDKPCVGLRHCASCLDFLIRKTFNDTTTFSAVAVKSLLDVSEFHLWLITRRMEYILVYVIENNSKTVCKTCFTYISR